MTGEIRPELRDFIATEITSIAHLELLLLLHRDPNQSWTAESAARELAVGDDAISSLLAGLAARGFASGEGTPPAYRFAPQTPALAQHVAELKQYYASRRVTIINLIYAGPVQKMRTFADAFRLKPKPEE